MEFTFISNNIHKKPMITHIDFDMVNIERKTFYGSAYFLDWANMNNLGRIVAKCDDADFEKHIVYIKKE